MPRLDSTSLRYIASIASIIVGVLLLVYVALDNDSEPEAQAVSEPTQPAESSPPAVAEPSPNIAPTLPPAAPALVKGTEADCHRGWRFFDNPVQRWTVCLPVNLLYFDGRDVLPLEAPSPGQYQIIYRDFAVVNEPWYLAEPTSTEASADYLGPISLKIDILAPAAALDGCPLRSQPRTPEGWVTCRERFAFQPGGAMQFTTEGPYQRFRALVSTQPDKNPADVFSLQLTVFSYSVNWPLQERLFASILESLKPY